MKLKELRESLNYSQAAIESITGIPQSTISRIERSDEKKVTHRLLERAIVLKVLDYEMKRIDGHEI